MFFPKYDNFQKNVNPFQGPSKWVVGLYVPIYVLWLNHIPHTSRYIMLFKILKSDIHVKSYKLICELQKKFTGALFFVAHSNKLLDDSTYSGPGGVFIVDTKKRSWAAWSFYSTPPDTPDKPEKTFYLCPSKKRKLPGFTKIPVEFKKGLWWPLG
jgi:hypothetical protein